MTRFEAAENTAVTEAAGPEAIARRPGGWTVFFRILKWGGVAMGLTTILLILAIALSNFQGSRKWVQGFEELKQRGEPYTLAQLQKQYGEIPGNAAKYYLAAAELAEDGQASPEVKAQLARLPLVGEERLPDPGRPLPPEQLAAVQTYLATKAEVFPLLAKAAEFDQCHYPVDFAQGMAMRLDHLTKLRQLARVLALKCAVEVQQGQSTQAVETVDQIFRLGESLEAEPVLISQLVRFAVNALGAQSLERVLSRGGLKPAELAALGQTLGRQKPDFAEQARRCFVGERAFGISVFIQVLNRGDRAGAQDLPFLARWLPITYAGLVERQFPDYLRFMNRMIDALKLPPSEARTAIQAEHEQLQARFERGGLATADCFMLELICPDLSRAYNSFLKNYEILAAARVSLAVEKFRIDRKRFPETLAQLKPAYLAEIPRDYFRPAGELQYVRKTGGEAAEGPDFSGYLIYSVGPDGEDNHGGVNPSGNNFNGYADSDLVFRRFERATAGETF